MSEQLKIRPYARLLTMLGDQLIKDEVIALVELAKNSYDADARHVIISFKHFNSDYSATSSSVIEIEDDGNGMDEAILKNAWMNPATPEKLKRKKDINRTDKGRIMQGEKGIGRFAVFKLGSKVQVTTRRQKVDKSGKFIDGGTDKEYVLTYDFSDYDADFLHFKHNEQEVFLDELNVSLETRPPQTIVSKEMFFNIDAEPRKPYGTKITISDLKGKWNGAKIDKVYQNLLRMQPIFGDKFTQDFFVSIKVNDKPYYSQEDKTDDLQTVLDEKSVFIVDGSFNSSERVLDFTLDYHDRKIKYEFKLDDPALLAISPMKDYLESIKKREIECGSFKYRFYVLDLDIKSSDKDTRYYLDPKQVSDVKAHRVYLYRDGLRVMPYGDPDDDWLMLDILRGTERSGANFANNQIVGYVLISQEQNPNLKDKTNREGLIEEGYAKEDLVKICQLLLRYLRTKPYSQYLIQKKNKRDRDGLATKNPEAILKNVKKEFGKRYVEKILKQFGDSILADVDSVQDEEAKATVNQAIEKAKRKEDYYNTLNDRWDELENAFEKEKETYETRIERTENLAAIGLSAETAYHDARILLANINNTLTALLRSYKSMDADYLLREAVVNAIEPIKNQVNNVVKLMNNVQRLFPSTNAKKSDVIVNNIIKKVKDLYDESCKKADVRCEIHKKGKTNLIVECTDAVLLQVFINLFDNSLYWLKTVDSKREICIVVDADNRKVIFSDSGPGIQPDDAPYIFEAFYSGKGEEGKGLGLYIARQLLERYNGSIDIAEKQDDRPLEGATFVLRFNPKEN